MPELVEIKPLQRRATAEMLQAAGVLRDQLVELTIALLAR
jgi:hypothetical protein